MAVAPDAASTPEELFAAVRALDAARPLVTFYDRASGERAELSAASLGNWVAKTHFLLTDGVGLGAGDAAFVDLPVHWLALPILFGVFSAGLAVSTHAAQAGVAFVDVEGLAGVAGLVPDVFAVPLLPWGRAFDAPPAGALDYVAAVRPQADAWASVRRTGAPTDPATDELTRAGVVAAARARAAELHLAAGARVLMTDRTRRSVELVDVLAVLSVGGSVVLVRHAGTSSDADLVAQEQISTTL